MRRIWSHRFKRWRKGGWKRLPASQLYGEYELVRLPSRLSAEAPERAERQQLLDAVARDGFMAGYRGLRIAKSGRRFRIEDGIIWQLIDANGVSRGQGATFSSWKDV